MKTEQWQWFRSWACPRVLPLVFNSTRITPVSQCLHLKSSHSIHTGSEHPWPKQGGVLEIIVAPSCRNRGMEEQEKRRRMHASVLHWQMNTSWELESTHGMMVLDPHTSLNQGYISLCMPINTCMHWGGCIHMYIYTQTYIHITPSLVWPQASREINSKMARDYIQVLSSDSY